jgi:hypothetical protein
MTIGRQRGREARRGVDENIKKEIKVWKNEAKEGIHTVTVRQYFQYLCSKNSAICDRLSDHFM